jgi:hypothetical protein
VPANLGALVMQLVAKDPAWRPGSAAEAAPDGGPSVTIGGGPLVTPAGTRRPAGGTSGVAELPG